MQQNTSYDLQGGLPYMPRISRRRRRTQEDPWVFFFALISAVMFYVAYPRVKVLARPWQIAIIIFAVSILFLLIYGGIHYTRRRHRERLMLTDTLSLSPSDFERRIQFLLQDLGWEHVAWVGGPGDGGVDLRGIHRGQRCIVQCKRYQGRVDPKYIRDLEGARNHEGADRAYLITTGYFTKQGYDWVRGKPIELWDGKILSALFYQQQSIIQNPAFHQQTRRKIAWIVCALIGINALILIWAFNASATLSSEVLQQPKPTEAVASSAIQQPPPSSTPLQDTNTFTDECGQKTIYGVERLTLRSAPGLATERIRDYPAGTIITILCEPVVEADDVVWQHVRIAETQGWMSTGFLK